MELVYLWVEDYKNIQKQGFNFSPRFSCDYDGKELTIKENIDKDGNKEYIENFFDDNINVTAIVGKNGSGKSSILKLILLLIFCKKITLKDEYYDKNPIYNEYILEAIRPFVNKNLFLIIFDEGLKKISMKEFIKSLTTEFRGMQDIHGKVSNLEDFLPRKDIEIESCSIIFPEVEAKKIKSFFIHFNYMLDTLYDGEEDKWIKEIYHKADSYTLPLLLEPYKNNNNREVIDLEIIEYLNNQNLLRFYHTLSSNKKISKFFNPNNILFYNPRFNFPLDINDKDFKCLEKSDFKGIGHKFWNIVKNEQVFLDIEEFDDNFCKIIEQIGDWYENINLLYILLKVKTSNKNLFNNQECKKYNDWLLKLLDNKYDITPPNINFDKLISKTAPDYEVRKIKTCIDFHKEKVYENDLFLNNIGKNVSIEDVKNILKLVPPWVDVEFFEDKKSIKSLSSGEKTFFTFLINLMYQVQNLNNRIEYDTIYLFLDETELGFHPQWQKEYLNDLLFSINQINKKKVYLMFATHSPFILSDIPKENIIFLNDKSSIKQTFGANIHTLLSDSFFMEDGLMGEFAKGKINDIKEFYEKVNNENKKEINNFSLLEIEYKEHKIKFEQIQSIIGEPFLKTIVKNQLEEIETILFKDKAKEIAIERFVKEFDKDDIMRVLNGKT